MTVRRLSDQALPFCRTAAKPRHVRRGRGLVDKDQTGRVQRCLVFPPGFACRFDVRAVLFGGVQGLFLEGDVMAAEEPPQARWAFLQTMSGRQTGLDLSQRCVRLLPNPRLFNADSPPGLSLICNSVRPSEVTDKKADSRIGNV